MFKIYKRIKYNCLIVYYQQIMSIVCSILIKTSCLLLIQVFSILIKTGCLLLIQVFSILIKTSFCVLSDGFNRSNTEHRSLLLGLLMTACDLSDQTKSFMNSKSIAVCTALSNKELINYSTNIVVSPCLIREPCLFSE